MGLQLILYLFAAATLFSFAAVQAQLVLPPDCTCPDECICNITSGSINCASRGLTEIPAEINSCAWPGIKKIDLNSNAITAISALAFLRLENVTHLFLYDNIIETIDPDAFVGLHSLQFLFLDGNRLRELHHTVFRPLTSLTRLLLYSNRLEVLPVGVFSELANLTTLALHNNQLASLDEAAFDGLHSLKQLYLHANRITDISNSPFRSLGQLTRLHLNSNRLSRLTQFDFIGLERLTTLVASDNKISFVADEAFSPLPNLLELIFQNNRISSINRLVFAGPVKLEEIDMRNNDISVISDGAFFRLTSLQRLFLHDNHIAEIREATFVGLNSLRELYLHGNEIHSIFNSTFEHLSQLEQMWMYGNRISCLEPEAFQGLSRLFILNLGDNELSYIPEEIFQPLENIVYLLLYGNQFKSIDNRPFQNLTRLLQLNFFFNDIRYITEGAMDGANRLVYFQWNSGNDLSNDNSLICDCSSKWLNQWMKTRFLNSKVLCAEPEQFRGQEIRSLEEGSFGCDSISLQVSVGPNCENHVVRREGCLLLECSSSPRASVQWSRVDGRELRRTEPHSCSAGMCQSEGLLLGGGDSVLLVENMQPQDAGYYMCTATIEGTIASQICRVTVGDPPEILAEPEEELLLSFPGPPAKFPFSVTGDPTPTVQWYHNRNGGNELGVPVVETGPDSRFLLSQSGTLLILETHLEDQGAYTGVANNGAGEVRVTAQLEFYFSTPCRGDCLNGGVCTTTPVHFCSCPEGFLGRYCEEYTDSPTSLAPDVATSEPATADPYDYYYYSGSGYSGDYSGYYYDEDEDFREKRALPEDSLLATVEDPEDSLLATVEDPEDSSSEEGAERKNRMQPSKFMKGGNKPTKQDWNKDFLYPLEDYDDGLNRGQGPMVKTGRQNKLQLKAPDHYSNPQTTIGERFNDDEPHISLNEVLHQIDE